MTNRLLRITRALPAAAFIALAAATCQRPSGTPAASSSTPPPPAPSAAEPAQGGVAGEWVHREMPVRFLESMTLRQQGERISGEGTYMMEGGRSGTSTIAGTWRGGTLRLDITRDSGVHERYVGRLEGDRLSGTLTVDGGDQPFAFERRTGT